MSAEQMPLGSRPVYWTCDNGHRQVLMVTIPSRRHYSRCDQCIDQSAWWTIEEPLVRDEVAGC